VRTINQAAQEIIGSGSNGTLPTLPIEAQINEEHRLARSAASSAVQHAIHCGELLAEQKMKVGHGQFGYWIKIHCEFSQATANNYMRAAKNPNALGISIRHLFPSGRPPSDREQQQSSPARHCTATNADGDVDDDQHGDAETEITVEDAIEILEPFFAQKQAIARYRGWRNKCGALRNKLKQAEAELTAAEAALIQAARDHKVLPS
jgi:Protein of unknown function (DUF3102)